MNQYFFLITVHTVNGPVSMDGTLTWEHGKTRHEIFVEIRKDLAKRIHADATTLPVLGFTLERNI